MFDVLTLAAVADELSATILDGRIQRIGLVDPRTLAAEVYAGGVRRYLVASADDRAHRLHLTPAMPSLDAQLITPFGLLLRKYARGGVIIGIEQPPLERIVRLSIAKRMLPHHAPVADPEAEPALPDEDDEDAEFAPDANVTYVHLAVELMGRHSNLILVDDENRVMESAKRVTPAMSRVRPVLPRLPYTPPPPLERPDPRRITAAAVMTWLAAQAPAAELARALITGWRGLSPQMAREIAFRATGDVTVNVGTVSGDAATAIARETRALFEPMLTAAWAPRVYRDPESSLPLAFSAVPMAHLAATTTAEAVPSISAAATVAFGSDLAADSPVRHQQRRERLLASMAAARERQERRLRALQEQAAQAANIERLREWGELIYAYLWQLQPGQAELAVDGVIVPLDPALSGKENAQRYFEQYRKAQGAGERTPELMAAVEAELAYIDQLRTLTSQAAGFAELEGLAAEWETYGGQTPPAGQPRRRQAPPRPRPLLDAEGNAVYVGHSGNQNAHITFELAGPNDSWLHARGVPGSHVVIRWRNPAADERDETVTAAAALAAHYSAARGSTSVEVDVARRRHVRKIKGAGPGMVTYRNERTLAVAPATERELAKVLHGTSE